MDSEDLNKYWRGGFYYDRSHVLRNNVAIQTYKLLMHYTEIHKNCRVGCYLMTNGFTKFYSLKQLIPLFDLFADVAENDKQLSSDSYPEFIKNITGATFQEQIEQVWRLKHPIRFEFNSKSLWSEIFSYDFGNAISINIDPDDISEVEGQSLDFFKISIKYYIIDIAFRDKITIK